MSYKNTQLIFHILLCFEKKKSSILVGLLFKLY